MTRIANRYAVERVLHEGRRSSVFAVRDERSPIRELVLKRLEAVDGRSLTSFTNEFRFLSDLAHPGLCRALDLASDPEGRPFMLLELAPGAPLTSLPSLPPRAVIRDLLVGVGRVLSYLSGQGLVHFDVKPDNIVVRRADDGRLDSVKLVDFDLAAMVAARVARRGTMPFVAPEVLSGDEAVDHRADLYSLGVVFYELLTGELPVGRFPPPSAKVSVDVRLDEVVLRSLEKEPERRYPHASELRSEIESVQKAPAPPADPPRFGRARGEACRNRGEPHAARRERSRLGGCLFAALVLMGCTFALSWCLVGTTPRPAEFDVSGLSHEHALLERAVLEQDAQAVRRAVINGVDPRAAVAGKPLLDHVIAWNDVDLARYLLAQDPGLAELTRWGRRQVPLELAILTGRAEIVDLLLAAGAQPNGQRRHEIARALAVAPRHAGRMIASCVAAGLSPNERFHVDPVLTIAIVEGTDEAVRTLLELGASPDGANGGEPPLVAAARVGRVDVGLALLDAGASTDRTDPAGISALMLASGGGELELVERLLRDG
ncbi:MAG: protein kinase, partial [Myxococcales bacterium]|nr:protein kinase [Myxococcales bacterium]